MPSILWAFPVVIRHVFEAIWRRFLWSPRKRGSVNLVILGGGFAGTQIARALAKEVQVTLVDEKEYFEFTPAVLRAFVRRNEVEKILIPHEKSNVKFLLGKALAVESDTVKLNNGQNISFDYLVVATGSSYPSLIKSPVASLAGRIKEIHDVFDRIKSSSSILIIGGGYVGVELAAEIAHSYPLKSLTLLTASPSLLPSYPTDAIRYVTRFLTRHHVRIITGSHVTAAHDSSGAAVQLKDLLVPCPSLAGPFTLALSRVSSPADSSAGARQVAEGEETMDRHPLKHAEEMCSKPSESESEPSSGPVTADVVFWCCGATANSEWAEGSVEILSKNSDQYGAFRCDKYLRAQPGSASADDVVGHVSSAKPTAEVSGSGVGGVVRRSVAKNSDAGNGFSSSASLVGPTAPTVEQGRPSVSGLKIAAGQRHVFVVGDCAGTGEAKSGQKATMHATSVTRNLRTLLARSESESESEARLESYPSGMCFGCDSSPTAEAMSLGPRDGLMILNGRVKATGWRAAAAKWLIGRSKVAALRGNVPASLLWTVHEQISPLMSWL